MSSGSWRATKDASSRATSSWRRSGASISTVIRAQSTSTSGASAAPSATTRGRHATCTRFTALVTSSRRQVPRRNCSAMARERRHLPSRIADLRGLSPSLRELGEQGRSVPLLYLEITGLDGLRGTKRTMALQVCKKAVAIALTASAGSVLRRGDVVAAGPGATWFAALLVGRAVDVAAQELVADPDLVVAAMRLRGSVLEAFRAAQSRGIMPPRAGVRAGWTVIEPVDPSAPMVGLRHALRGAAVVARVEERRSTFLASVTHELRTPLTAIVGYVERLRISPRLGSERRRRYLDIVASEAARLSRLV